MADFEPAFQRTLKAEGGFRLTNIKGDRGGQTYAGIARKMHPRWPGWEWIDRDETPPTDLVRDIYRAEFWAPLQCSRMAQEIAEDIYDFAVNAGPRVSAKLAQAVAGVAPDGAIGPKTIEALEPIDPASFRPLFALAKIARYRDIVTRDRSQGRFLLGWINRTIGALQ